MQMLTPKAMKSYAGVLEYEAQELVRSLLKDTKNGVLSVCPRYHVGRYSLKYAPSLSLRV